MLQVILPLAVDLVEYFAPMAYPVPSVCYQPPSSVLDLLLYIRIRFPILRTSRFIRYGQSL
jgi:hypothetical protein